MDFFPRSKLGNLCFGSILTKILLGMGCHWSIALLLCEFYALFRPKERSIYPAFGAIFCILGGISWKWGTFLNETALEIQSLVRSSPLPKSFQGISLAILLGKAQYLDQETKFLAQNTGVMHLFAASGLHLGIFLSLISLSVTPLFKNLRISWGISLLFGFLYLVLVEFPLSFVRAYSFYIFFVLSKIFYVKLSKRDLFWNSFAGVWLWRGAGLGSPSSWLSYGAIFAILFAKPKLDPLFPYKKGRFAFDLFSLSSVCTFYTIPTCLWFFGKTSLLGILANLIAIPWIGISLPLLGLTIILFKVTKFPWIWVPYEFALKFLLSILDLMQKYLSMSITIQFEILIFWSCCFLLLLILKSPVLHLVIYLLFFVSLYLNPRGQTETAIYIEKGLFVYDNGYKVNLDGYCKNTQKKIQFLDKNDLCRKRDFQVTHRSCLSTALSCQRKGSKVSWIGVTPMPKAWESELEIPSKPKHPYLLYRGTRNGRNDLLKNLLGPSEAFHGILFLDLPPWSKETKEDILRFQKILGVSSRWKTISLEEVQTPEKSKNPFRNPELSQHKWLQAPKEIWSELSHRFSHPGTNSNFGQANLGTNWRILSGDWSRSGSFD